MNTQRREITKTNVKKYNMHANKKTKTKKSEGKP